MRTSWRERGIEVMTYRAKVDRCGRLWLKIDESVGVGHKYGHNFMCPGADDNVILTLFVYVCVFALMTKLPVLWKKTRWHIGRVLFLPYSEMKCGPFGAGASACSSSPVLVIFWSGKGKVEGSIGNHRHNRRFARMLLPVASSSKSVSCFSCAGRCALARVGLWMGERHWQMALRSGLCTRREDPNLSTAAYLILPEQWLGLLSS